jgi:hypothetical protein
MQSKILNKSSGSYQEYINQNVTVHSATTALDATGIDADHKIFTSGVLAAAITLPQATTSNAGMIIEIYITATVATDGTCLVGFADAGSTVFGGLLMTSITNGAAAKEVVARGVTANSKRLVLDADNVATAGGALGSWYRVIYQGANKVWVTGLGLVTGSSATLPSAACSTTTGVDG